MFKKIFSALAVGFLFMGVGCSAPVKIQKIINSAATPETPQTTTTTEVATPAAPEAATYVESNGVRWQKPLGIEDLKLFSTDFLNNGGAYAVYRKVGIFNYQDQTSEIIIAKIIYDGPGAMGEIGETRYFFAKNNNGFTLLAKVSSPLSKKIVNGAGEEGLNRTLFSIDGDTVIRDLVFPIELRGALPRQKVVLKEVVDSEVFLSNKLLPGFTDLENREIKQDPIRRSFVLVNNSPLAGVYTLELDMYSKENKDGLVPAITWSDGKKNNGEYLYQSVGGCGYFNYARVVDPTTIDLKKDLAVIGKTAQGDFVYGLIDDSHKFLKDMYDLTSNSDGKITYQNFIDQRPLVFWVDPFGRIIVLSNNRFVPQAECGKPVIYLYPKKIMNVSVNVKPKGGLTYSEPPLKDGWEVEAKPNGDLTEIKTGKYFPYLFWEGRGDIYEQPKQGWVVKQSGVKRFLQTKLALLGLTRSETSDFMDFWLPKMQDKPYYFVTFLGNATMEKLAPLTVDPKPDTVIRILMDFTPLDKPAVVKGYTIHTPKRTGFTVVEWGGVVR